jgi:hypothetical protein
VTSVMTGQVSTRNALFNMELFGIAASATHSGYKGKIGKSR